MGFYIRVYHRVRQRGWVDYLVAGGDVAVGRRRGLQFGPGLRVELAAEVGTGDAVVQQHAVVGFGVCLREKKNVCNAPVSVPPALIHAEIQFLRSSADHPDKAAGFSRRKNVDFQYK
jgi:hypothetical protein